MTLASHVRIWGVLATLGAGTIGFAQTPDGDQGRSGAALPVESDAKRTAAKLAGLVRFVDAFCPSLKPNYSRFRDVIQSLNVEMKDLESGDILLRSSEYTSVYQKDVPSNCENAAEKFGPGGSVMQSLFVEK
jgi:hypothetical protein